MMATASRTYALLRLSVFPTRQGRGSGLPRLPNPCNDRLACVLSAGFYFYRARWMSIIALLLHALQPCALAVQAQMAARRSRARGRGSATRPTSPSASWTPGWT